MSSADDRDAWDRTAATGAAVRSRLPLTDSVMVWGVVAAVVLALVLRLIFLGDRVAHFDEGRVAYWSLYTQESGHFAYRRIIHGPLLQHLDRYLFGFFGATDFVMRLPVVIVGGLLPASAWLFRKHLRRTEVVAMAFVLALNPVLLYYSRFMRSDVLVAAFMFVALGFLVRYYDTRNHRYLYAATAFVALGFGSKENAIVYVLTWLGAAALLADQALFRPREYHSGAHLLWAKLAGGARSVREDRIDPWLNNLDDALDRYDGDTGGRKEDTGGEDEGRWAAVRRVLAPLRFAWYGLAILLIAVAIFLFIYAPRGAGYAGLRYPVGDPTAHLGLWDAVGDPTKLPALFDATWSHTVEEFVRWFSASSEPGCNKSNVIDGYLCYAGRYVEVMAWYGGATTAFAIFGFVAERYGAETTRNLAMFAAYGGFVSVIGYPLGTDVWGAWIVVHAMVPLSIPAAVGIGVILRWGRESYDARDGVGVGIAMAILLVTAGFAGVVSTTQVYSNHSSGDNMLVQYAQPSDDARGPIDAMERAAGATDGTDVLLYYGEQGDAYDGGEALVKRNIGSPNEGDLVTRPACSNWYNPLLPMGWYFEKADADVECVREAATLTERVENGSVPVVMTTPSDATVPTAVLEEHYEKRSFTIRTGARERTLWIRAEFLEE